MANLNLSQFGENTSVSDADYTFVWDSANSISKKVTRNSWLTSPSLSTSAPVTISQTWADSGQTFKALVVNAAGSSGTNSASGSLLLDLQVGGTSQFSVTKGGAVNATGAFSTPAQFIAGDAIFANGNGVRYVSTWIRSAGFDGGLLFRNNTQTQSVGVVVEADNTLALRNGAAAQTFNVYGTYTSASVYERMFMRYNGTDLAFQVGAETLGATARPLQLWTGGASRLHITTAGNVGIGTTAPGAKLEVVTSTAFDGIKVTNSHTSSAAFLSLINNAGSDANFGCYSSGTGDGFANNAGFGAKNSVIINADGSVLSGGSNSIQFRAGGYGANQERMRITAAGNVGIGTTSPTSKLHVVGDAVLTGDLLGTNYTIGVPTILTQSNISITNNHSGVADSAIVITPKGAAGIIVGPKPDGTATGGNARGLGSIDLQIARGSSIEVASGVNSFIAGGYGNRASSTYAVILGGSGNVASANYASISGGQSCTASGLNSVVGGGQSNTASAQYSVIGGGISNSATAVLAFIAGGASVLADRYSLSAHAAGQFSAVGDAQTTKAVFRNKTTTNSAVELFLDGASARYTVTSGKIISMLINITGTKSDGSAVAHYVRQYSIKNIGGTTSEVYAAVTVGADNAAGTSIALSANDTNDALKIEVTGVTSETWRWVASVDAVEVGHGT